MTGSFDLNKAQRDALALDRNVALRAVAGSGKTTVLVSRYLKVLEDEPALTPARILAVTFSESAARQLREKLRDEVRGRKNDSRWRKIYDTLNDAPISTIHAFCADRLREHAIEAQVDPDFAILDAIDAALLVGESVRQTCAGVRKGSPLHAAILVVASNLTRTPQRLLERLITRREVFRPVVEDIAGTSPGRMVEAAREHWVEFSRAALDSIGRTELADLMDNMIELAGGAAGKAREAVEIIRAARTALERARSDVEAADMCFDGLQKVFLTGKGTARKRAAGTKREWVETELHERYKHLFAASARIVEQLGLADRPRFGFRLEQCAAETMHALIDVYHTCLVQYDEAKRRRHALDFCDLQDRFVDMLERCPDIRRSLSERFIHILVDEFQDTNRLQWRIVHMLAGNDSGRLRPRGLFIVGDEAQSIYGFRNAEVEVFRDVRDSILASAEGVDIPSSESFRHAQHVADGINALFGGDEGYLELDPSRKRVAGTVEVISIEEEEDDIGVAEQCAREARVVVDRIRAATQPGPLEMRVERHDGTIERAGLDDIAVLLRRRTHLEPVLDALETAGAPYYIEGGTGFYRQQEIWDVLTALRCIAVPDDEIALAGHLRSPLVGMSDEMLLSVSIKEGVSFRAKLARYAAGSALARDAVDRLDGWRERAGRVTLDDLVRSVCDETGLWMALASDPRAPQPEENVKRLIDEARSFTASEGRNVRLFLERMDYLVEHEWPQSEALLAGGLQDAVRVMTCHQAKGLEFPVVVVMQCHLKYNFGGRETVRVHRQAGIGFKCPDPDDGYRRAETVSMWRTRRAEETDTRDEEMRLLHVACTRARDGLILSGYGDEPNRDSWWHVIRERLPATDQIVTYRSIGDIEVERAARETESFDRGVETLDEMLLIAERPAPEPEGVSAETRRLLDGLERVPGAQRPVDMSPTQWLVYRECPRRYFYRYLIGAEEPGSHDPAADGASPPIRQTDEIHHDALEFGRIVHRAFELVMCGNSIDRAAEVSVAEFQRLLPDVKQSIRTILQQFSESSLGQAVSESADKRPEQTFIMRLAGMTVQGSIDLLWQDAPGRWHIVDYKTSRSKYHTDAGTARRAMLAGRYQPQLALYALAARDLIQTDVPVTSTLYFTDAPDNPYEYPPFDTEEAGLLEEQLAEAADVISVDPARIDSFPLAPDVHGEKDGMLLCHECGFYHASICEVCRPPNSPRSPTGNT